MPELPSAGRLRSAERTGVPVSLANMVEAITGLVRYWVTRNGLYHLTNIKVLGVTCLGGLLTAKPVMFVANVVRHGFENDPHLDAVRQRAEDREGGRRSGLR